MTHLTPEEQSALDRLHAHKMQAQSSLSFWANAEATHGKDGKWIHPDDWEKQMANIHHLQSLAAANVDAFTLAADAIEERAGLAGQVAVLREAIRTMQRRLHNIEGHNQWFERCESAWCNPSKDADPGNILSALALTLPQAAQQVAGWKERAELLEWLMQYSESRFSQWMARYKAGTMMGHMTLIDALRAAKEASDE